MKSEKISIAIPAYNRVDEFIELLDSVLLQSTLPYEVVVCEDVSPSRFAISQVCADYAVKFNEKNVIFSYFENDVNLGYDANIRKCIEVIKGDWCVLMGNDDILLPNAIEEIERYIDRNDVSFISRTFVRFTKVKSPALGISSICDTDQIFSHLNSSSRYIFRTAGFVGGLVIKKSFALLHSTSKFDGTLYYQIYLAAHAFCNSGIGYISKPIIGGRADNPPMFGSASNHDSFHVPGRYSAKARVHMWLSVLDIALSVGKVYKINLIDDLRYELKFRQSFHVFEMNTSGDKSELNLLKAEFIKADLFYHPLPVFLFYLNYYFGSFSGYFYKFARYLMQSNKNIFYRNSYPWLKY